MVKRECLGERFGRLTVIGDAPKENPRQRRKVMCRCDCGNIVPVRLSNLVSGNTQSCGCLEKELTIERTTKHKVGDRFGRLVILEELNHINGKRKVLCQCDCGNQVAV